MYYRYTVGGGSYGLDERPSAHPPPSLHFREHGSSLSPCTPPAETHLPSREEQLGSLEKGHGRSEPEAGNVGGTGLDSTVSHLFQEERFFQKRVSRVPEQEEVRRQRGNRKERRGRETSKQEGSWGGGS